MNGGLAFKSHLSNISRMKSKKALILGLVVAAAAGWAVWYQFIREKTLGEKIEDAGEKVGRSVDKLIDKVK